MTWILLSLVAVLLAAIPATMFWVNLPRFQQPIDDVSAGRSASDHEAAAAILVSVLIPARDEAMGIEESVQRVLESEGVAVEVVVLDDHSSDATATIVQRIAERDPRVRCVPGQLLPKGWNGKQFACYQLAELAAHRRMVFLDADVRLRPRALQWLTQQQDASGVSLLSIFPHQQTGTWLERWLIPLMHWILLGFLPFQRMRQSPHPAYAAGCGQLFMTERDDYQRAGTHAAIAGSRHDGVKLPKAYREAGMQTDVLDGSELAECRMYRSGREVIRGVLKNAVEGIANPKLIVPFTVLLVGSAVLPWLTLLGSLLQPTWLGAILSLTAIALSYLPRIVAIRRLRQSRLGAVCHPLAVGLFVILQWVALLRYWSGRQVAWRGRAS